MWLLFVLSALIACVAAEYDHPDCPRNEDISPCYCERKGDDALIVCENIRNVTRLDKVLTFTKGKNFGYDFFNVRFGDMPSDFFEGQLINYLYFENCKITSFGEKPFSGLEDTLVEFYLYGSVDQVKNDMKTFPLGHLKKLEIFYVSENKIEVLENDLFRNGPGSIKQVTLWYNEMRRLGDKAFAPLVNLEEAWLGYNKLENVSRSMFPQPAEKLKILNFDTNRIATLPDGFLDDMPALEEVDFYANKLETISEEAWGKAWDHLQIVHLGYNRIVCDEKIKWIYQREHMPEVFSGTCRDGKHKGKFLDELTVEDFE